MGTHIPRQDKLKKLKCNKFDPPYIHQEIIKNNFVFTEKTKNG